MKKRGYAATYLPDTYELTDDVQLAAANFIGGSADEPTEMLKKGDKVASHDEIHFGFVKEVSGARAIVQWGFMEQGQFWPTKKQTLLANHLKRVESFPNDKKAAASNWMGSFLNIEARGSVNG